METLLEWGRGPIFRATFAFMLLGLMRHVVLTLSNLYSARKRAGDKAVPYGQLITATIGWLFPLTKIRERTAYSLASIAFHVGLIVTPIFLAGHIALWREGLGIGWLAINPHAADALTVITIVAAAGLIIGRLATLESRALSRPQDYGLLVLIAAVFVSGFMVAHPRLNPFAYSSTMLVHVLTANAMFVAVPLTKLSHCVLLPFTQVVADLGWRFPADAGEHVAVALGKENEPI